MRCISPFKNYSIQVFEGQEELVVDGRGFGQSRVLTKPVLANFEQGGLLDHEVAAALSAFNFSALPEGVNPLSRISVFDTLAFVTATTKPKERDEMQVQVEERLRELQRIFPNDFIIVEEPRAPKPWGSYDSDTSEEVLAFRERLAVDPWLVLRYEQENENRAEIVEAMQALVDPGFETAGFMKRPEPEEPAPVQTTHPRATVPVPPKPVTGIDFDGLPPIEVQA